MVALAVTLLALAAAGSATPVPIPSSSSSPKDVRSLPVTASTQARSLEWAQAKARHARRRYTRLSQNRLHEPEKRGTTELKAWGDSYSVQASVGTPPQTLSLFLDTGSTDMWVIGSCDEPNECASAATFDARSSSSYIPTKQLFAMRYLDGGVSRGVWGGDVVSVGGWSVNTFFGITSHTTKWETAQSGLLGLATRAGSSKRVEPWWEAASAAWTDKQFGIYLGRPGRNGTVTFGGVDTSKYTGAISYYPATSLDGWDAGWSLPTAGLALNGRRLSTSTATMAVLDSGTTGIVGPKRAVDAFYASLPAPVVDLKDGSYAFECSAPMGINASFSFGDYAIGDMINGEGETFSLRDEDLAVVRGSGDQFAATGGYEAMREVEGTWCFGAVSSWSSTIEGADVDAWILGDAFLKNVYSVYRGGGERQVGLAHLAEEGKGEVQTWDNVPSAGDEGLASF